MFLVKARSFRISVLVVELDQALQVADMMEEGIAELNFAYAGASDAYYLLKSTAHFLSWCLPWCPSLNYYYSRLWIQYHTVDFL